MKMKRWVSEVEYGKMGWLKGSVAIVGAYFFTLSLQNIIAMWNISVDYFGVAIYGSSVFVMGLFVFAAWIIYRMLKRGDKRLHIVSGSVGLVLSMAIVYGSYVHFQNDIFQSAEVVVLQLGLVMGFWLTATALSEEILNCMNGLTRWNGRQEDKPWRIDSFFQKRKGAYFGLAWLFYFVSFLPAFLCWWPGNFVYDAPFQMTEVIYETYTTSHPLLHTLLMGWMYNLGMAMGNASAGFQFYTLIQMLLLSGAFAYCSYYLYRKQVPRVFRIVVLLWNALFPMHAMFSITATKDVMFAAFFLSFVIYLIRLIVDKERFKWSFYAGVIASGVLCVLMRNNIIAAILIVGFFVLVAAKGGWKPKVQIAVIFAAIYIISGLINMGLVYSVDAQDTISQKERLSVPLQCMARVACYRRNELDDSLYDEVCMYIREEDIPTYNPYLSDAIKFKANEALLRDNFGNFMKLWVKIGLQFPDEYIESILTNTMGYWYPLDQGAFAVKPMEFYHKLLWISDEIEKMDYCPPANKYYSFLFWGEGYRDVPVLGYLCRMDVWVWFFNFYWAWCVYDKNRKAALLGVLPLVYLIGCYLGPIPIMRYIYCLVVTVPMYLYVIMGRGKNQEIEVNA